MSSFLWFPRRSGEKVRMVLQAVTFRDLTILLLQSSLLVFRCPGESGALLLCPVLSNTLSFPGLSDDSSGPCFRPVIRVAYRHDCPLHPPAQRSQAVSPPAKSGLQMCVVCFVVLTFFKIYCQHLKIRFLMKTQSSGLS